jgi:hypothetical protein
MPLDRENEMARRVELNGLDNTIRRRDGADQKIVAGNADGLMVAGVDPRFGQVAGRNQAGQPGTRRNMDRMGLNDLPAGAVIDGGLQVLNQGAVAPYIQRLGAVADGEDGLLEVEGVLEEELVNGSAGGVRLAALRDWIFAKSLWVHIVKAAGEQNSLGSEEEPGNAIRALVKRNNNGGCARGVEGGKVGRQGALVVAGVAAGGFGDGDV